MKKSHISWLPLAAVLSAAFLPAAAAADEDEAAPFAGFAPLAAVELDGQRGGAEVLTLNESTTSGAVHDNQANFAHTGGNWISDGSFAGAAGIPVVVQNSGNNVLIQNSTIINMQVQ